MNARLITVWRSTLARVASGVNFAIFADNGLNKRDSHWSSGAIVTFFFQSSNHFLQHKTLKLNNINKTKIFSKEVKVNKFSVYCHDACGAAINILICGKKAL